MKTKYSTWILAFLFVSGAIIVYKTVDNFNFITAYIGKIISAAGPFITGFVIAYLLNLPTKKLQGAIEKAKPTFIKKHSKGIAITIVYLLALLAVTVVIRLIVPAIYNNLYDLYLNRNVYITLMMQKLSELEARLGRDIFATENIAGLIQDYFKNMQLSEFGKYAQGVVNVTSGVISFFIAVIISVYMLSDKTIIIDGLRRIINVFLPKEKGSRLLELLHKVNTIFSRYLLSVIFAGMIVGVASTILMSLLRVKYALVLGLLMGLFSLIPYFGAIIAITVCVLVTLITGGWFQALWVAIALIILQQADGNYIGPKIMGNMLDARPLLIIFAVTVGGGLFGLWGMILSVPIVMVIKMLLTEYINAKEAKKGDGNA